MIVTLPICPFLALTGQAARNQLRPLLQFYLRTSHPRTLGAYMRRSPGEHTVLPG